MPMRVVLGTNQYVSALLKPDELQARLLRLWRDGAFELCISEAILAELADVLNRPYFRERWVISKEEVSAFICLLRRHATMTPGTTEADAVPRDPTDNKFLACAVEGEADVLISGDDHLLDLTTYENIPIITAAEFWSRLERDATQSE